jgi:hypothetical protein
MLWCTVDPETNGWIKKESGMSYMCGVDAVTSFLAQNRLGAMIRSHQAHEAGNEKLDSGRIITVWSASNYGGENENKGSYVVIDNHMRYGFKNF